MLLTALNHLCYTMEQIQYDYRSQCKNAGFLGLIILTFYLKNAK